jgi:hypothetical protein
MTAASPPAELPETTISATEENKSFSLSKEANWATVILWPLKNNLLPLYLTGSFFDPCRPEPSQYLSITFVQFLKVFYSDLEEKPSDKISF